MKNIVICPNFNALYYSFYVKGLIDCFGEANIGFSYDGFPDLPDNILAFVAARKLRTRVVIDSYDGVNVTDTRALEWCDVFGKVNLISSRIPNPMRNKSVAIGPSFPCNLWSAHKAFLLASKHYRRSKIASAWQHFGNYGRQYKYRLPCDHYVPGVEADNYIFFSSSIWDEAEAPNTNQNRVLFIESCRSLKNVIFEGGFIRPSNSKRAAKYEKYIANQQFSHTEWLRKTKQTALVFYTPAVWSSHSWKLAEYLALGKAIISTPISRELPAPLIHGQHIHYAEPSFHGLRHAIALILNNRDYRVHLEQNAYRYYLKYLAPARVVERLLNHTPAASEKLISNQPVRLRA